MVVRRAHAVFVAELVSTFITAEREQREEEKRMGKRKELVRASSLKAYNKLLKDKERAAASADVTCGCFGAEHPLRHAARNVLASELWQGLVILIVLASCAEISMDNPRLDPSSLFAHQLLTFDYAITAFFATEAMLKVVVGGAFSGDGAYFNSTKWNYLDFAVLLSSLAALLPGLHHVRDIRLLRLMKPLRIIARVPGVRMLFEFFAAASGDLSRVLMVVAFFHVIFAILGMELFMVHCSHSAKAACGVLHPFAQSLP